MATGPAPAARPGLGSFLVFLAAVGFSFKSILIKLGYGYGVDATSLFALRQLFSAPFFVVLALWSRDQALPREALTRRDWLQLAGLGLLGYYVAAWLDFLGLRYISAGLERLILFLYPTIVLVLSAWWLGTRIRGREFGALVLSYGGIALVFLGHAGAPGGEWDLALGSSLVFASAVAYSVYLIGSSQVVHRFGTVRFTAWAMLVATVVGVAQFLATHGLDSLRLPLPVYGLCAVMAVFSTVLPALLMTEGLRRVGANQAALVGTVGPVVTMLLAVVILDDTLDAAQIAGAVLVLAGVLLVSLRPARTAPVAE